MLGRVVNTITLERNLRYFSNFIQNSILFPIGSLRMTLAVNLTLAASPITVEKIFIAITINKRNVS